MTHCSWLDSDNDGQLHNHTRQTLNNHIGSPTSSGRLLIHAKNSTMATRGIYQLTTLRLHYCEVGGSSRALREYIGNGQLIAWAERHPYVKLEVKRHNGHHPTIHADYVTNSKQAVHQVSVKNYETWEHVEEVVQMLANRSGRKITKITKPVLTDTPSVQGVWTPFLNLQHEPEFDIDIIDPSPSSIQPASMTTTSSSSSSM